MNNTALQRTLFIGLFTIIALGGLLMLTQASASAGVDPVAQQTPAPTQTDSSNTICFVSDGMVSCVKRPGLRTSGTLTDQVRTLMQALVEGPSPFERASGVRSSLPAGSALLDVRTSTDRATIRFELPQGFIDAFDDGDSEDINAQIATTLTPFNFNRVDVEVRDPSDTNVFRPLSSFLPTLSIPVKPGEQDPDTPTTHSGEPPANGQPQANGALSNKTVFVSAGHGWYWSTNVNQFRTQRPHYPSAPYPSGEGTVEDFNNAEVVNQYLLQYLWNAGADAWTVRERDMNTSMLIVDNSDVGFSTQGAWSLDGMQGYAGSYRYASSVTSGATATATWTFTPTVSAKYALTVWFPSASNRTAVARYFVEHAAGTTPLTITQERDASDWRYIGTYSFKAGQAGRLRLNNQSVVAGKNVLADAIRIGGGVGSVTLPGAPGPTSKPRWEEQSKQYAMWVGLPDAASLNDVIVRPIYSEWESEVGEDSIYISWHTNGFNGYNTTARGTESYIHSFEPTSLSDRLQYWVHNELIGDIHSGWDAAWPDRGKKAADLGELRLLDSMPGILIENGYHDNPQDTDALKEPRFNQLSARAVYQGIVRYWHEQDPANVPLIFLPEPPTRLRVRNSGPNAITIAWQPGASDGIGLLGDAATSYRVYTSTDGFGWGNAIASPSASLTLNGLAPGQLIYVRVTGVNAGGESFPTPVLAARVASNTIAPVLLVYGFERIDRTGLIKQNDPPEGFSRRMFLDRINRFDYIVQHAEAITYPFDSAMHAAVTFGDVGVGNYKLVDWISGEEQTPDVSLNATDQSLLQSFLSGGGALLVSGAEIGFDMVSAGYGASFYNNTLHASFLSDDAGTYSVAALAGNIFDGLGTFSFDDGTHGTYDADWPDRFNPLGAAQSALVYNGALGGGAALTYASGACTRLVYMGFPIETVYPDSTRNALFARAIDFLDACVTPGGGAAPDTSIASPGDGAAYNTSPSFNGTAGGTSGVATVQVALISGTQFYNGSVFVPGETWLTATGTLVWSYALPALPDGDYEVRARAIAPGPLLDASPASVIFTLDTIPPSTPSPLAPIGDVLINSPVTTFSWSPGNGANGFDFELDGVPEILNSPVLSYTRVITEGQHQWRVRAFDRAGNTSTWSTVATFQSSALHAFLPLVFHNFVSEQAPEPTCNEAISNGGFETGLSGWSSLANNPAPASVSAPVLVGSQSARIGSAGAQVNGFSSLQQAVSIPADAISATLMFARYRVSGDTTNDLQYVAVVSGTNTILDYLVFERVNDPAWLDATFDLLPYAGQNINLRFSVRNDGAGGVTRMFVDAVSLQVCTPQGS